LSPSGPLIPAPMVIGPVGVALSVQPLPVASATSSPSWNRRAVPSAAWVKAGALYSLDWDYADLGAQCGEIAARVLQGSPPASIPAAAPRKVQYTLNLYTASQMKLKLSDQMIGGAQQTY